MDKTKQCEHCGHIANAAFVRLDSYNWLCGKYKGLEARIATLTAALERAKDAIETLLQDNDIWDAHKKFARQEISRIDATLTDKGKPEGEPHRKCQGPICEKYETPECDGPSPNPDPPCEMCGGEGEMDCPSCRGDGRTPDEYLCEHCDGGKVPCPKGCDYPTCNPKGKEGD